jgi:dynein heavy chain
MPSAVLGAEELAAMSKDELLGLADERHRCIVDMVAAETGLSADQILDQLSTADQMECFQNFLIANGAPQLLFFYQTSLAQGSSRPVSGARVSMRAQKTIQVTNGKERALKGKCIYFIRHPKKALDKRTIAKSITMSCFSDEDNGIVQNLESMIEHVYIPALKGRTDNAWGSVEDDKVSDFLESLGRFSHVLQEASDSMNVSVQLRHPDAINANDFKSPADYVEAGKNAELVDSLEELVGEWCKQIEQVLAESSQMRKEADDIGPKAELEHWKNRTAKFNALTDQIKSRELQVVISIMHIAKSRLLKQWQELDNRITDAANEAKDNVKYLYTLGRLCEPLYKCNPVELIDAIPGLLNAIKMIYSISRYYNTSERMTSLFVKITNQMITSCKTYIYQEQGKKLWDYERTALIERLQNCVALNDSYQRCFNRVKAQLAEDPDQRQFDFSEMYIFGKFDTFCKRILRVINMLNIIQNFSAIGNSDIEDIDILARQFTATVANVKRKSYDILDHRKM